MSSEEVSLNFSINPNPEPGPNPDPTPKRKSRSDDFFTECQYYGTALRNLVPTLTNKFEQRRAIPWVNKLFGPQYHVKVLRDKRNRYLASLVINIINDKLIGVFEKCPPEGATKDLRKMKVIPALNAEWEEDKTWSEYVDCLEKEYKEISCNFHNSRESCKQESFDTDQQLDVEFQFLLYQIRPYAVMLTNPESKTKIAAWMQTLCRISKEKCSKMKVLRNEYAYALFGYIQDLRIAGPFQDYPPFDNVPPLKEAAKQAAKQHPLTSPICEEAESFMCDQPTLEEGAFCYIAITGEFAQSDSFLPA